jgi:purine-nucleoside phosphorylase
MDYDRCNESAQFLMSRTSLRPKIGIICGTGLGTLADLLTNNPDVVPYASIPHFPISTGTNHKSQMLFGKLKTEDGEEVEVMIMLGRFHLYEGYSIDQVQQFPEIWGADF